MSDPGYPSRALDRRWRVSYKRRSRHLLIVCLLCSAVWVVVVAGVVTWAVEDVIGPWHRR